MRYLAGHPARAVPVQACFASVARWLGVDVGGKRKGFDIALVDDRRLLELEGGLDHDAVLERVEASRPTVVAVDSPRCCAPDGQSTRAGERQLAEAICGIRWTPDAKRVHASDYYAWIVEGLPLFDALAERGVEVIEVFPTASWTRWHGTRGSRSRSAWTRDGLASRGLDGLPGQTNQDQRDAIAAAVTARQYSQGMTEAMGEIVVPAEGRRATLSRHRGAHAAMEPDRVHTIAALSGRLFATFPAAVVVPIVNEQEEFLLLESPRRQDWWEPVNGAVDGGETLLEAALRVLREEAGPDLRVRPLGVVHASTFQYDASVSRMISVVYLMAHESCAVAPGDGMRGSRVRWATISAIEAGGLRLLPPLDQAWLRRRTVDLFRLWKHTPAHLLQGPLSASA